MTTLSGKNNFIEDILEKAGAIHTLQSFRETLMKASCIGLPGKFCHISGWAIRSRAISTKFLPVWDFSWEQTQEGRENTPDTNNAVIKKLKQELQQARKNYWVAVRMWWEFRKSFFPGPFFKGFDLWRSNPRWCLHRAFREGCAGKGGCCGRGCGCCTKRLIRSDRLLGIGHCSEKCGCCERARGSKTPDSGGVERVDKTRKFLKRIDGE